MSPEPARSETRPAISIATSFDFEIPFQAQVPLIAEAGFTHVSLGAREDHSQYRSAAGRARIAALLRANDLALDTIHGPRLDQPDSTSILADVAQAAATLGAGVVVVHPPLYPTHDAYVARVTASADKAVADGFMLQDDAQRLIAEADASSIGKLGPTVTP